MRSVLAVLAAAALAAPVAAQINDGSVWTDGEGMTASVDVTETPEGTMVTVTTADGFTSAVEGTDGPGSTVSGFPAGTTTGGNDTVKGSNGKLQKKVGNTWVNLRRAKKGAKGCGGQWYLQAGQHAPSDGWLRSNTMGDLQLWRGQIAPWAGIFTGEEVVSLPH